MRLTAVRAPGSRIPASAVPALEAVAERLAPRKLHVQVVWADDKMMRRLNRKFRDRDRATDVLSFRYEDTPTRIPGDPDAEIYVSIERAIRQARDRGHRTVQELVLLVLHGLLHLQGHEHHTGAGVKRMRAAEKTQLGWLEEHWPALDPLKPLLANAGVGAGKGSR